MNYNKRQLHLQLSARDDARIPPPIEAEVIRALAELLLAAATDGLVPEGEGLDDE